MGAVVAVVRGLETATREMANALVREKTAREAQARSIEALNRARQLETAGRLVGGVAHDLNNLLTPIVTYGNLLIEQHPQIPDVVEAGRGIVNAANDAASLTHQLLAFSRPGTQARVPVDLHALLESTFTLMGRTLSKNIAIELSLSSLRHTVLGDATLLRNAFANLAMNARDAMPQGGVAGTVTTAGGERAAIEAVVRDSGVRHVPRGSGSAAVRAVLHHQARRQRPGSRGGLRHGAEPRRDDRSDDGRRPGHYVSPSLSTDRRQARRGRSRRSFKRSAAAGVVAAGTRGKVLVVDDEPLVRKVIVKPPHRAAGARVS